MNFKNNWSFTLLSGGSLLLAGALITTHQSELSENAVDPQFTNGRSKFKEFGFGSVHYRDSATDNPPLLLLHGMASSLHTWAGWTSVLGESYRLVRPDLPGFGLTGPRGDDTYTIQSYVKFLDEFINRLNLERVSLAGNSFGGFLALRYSLKYPERVNKLIAINSMGLESDWPFPFSLGTLPFSENFSGFTPRLAVKGILSHIYGDANRLSEKTIDRLYKLLRREGNRRALINFIRDITHNSSSEFNGKLNTLQVPVLIQWGLEDPWFPQWQAERFRDRIPNSSLITYLSAGHVPMEEIPDQTARDARSFLGG